MKPGIFQDWRELFEAIAFALVICAVGWWGIFMFIILACSWAGEAL